MHDDDLPSAEADWSAWWDGNAANETAGLSPAVSLQLAMRLKVAFLSGWTTAIGHAAALARAESPDDSHEMN